MRSAALAIVLVLLWPAQAHAQTATIQALAVGDSITVGYGPAFVTKFEARGLGKAHWIGTAGSVACDAWADWITDFPKSRLDFVVIEDYAPGGAPCTDKAAYRAAMQDVVNAAKAKSAYVIVLDGRHPDLSAVAGIDILDYAVPAPDDPDCIHYTDEGYKLYAKNVVNLLDSLIA
jgi:hypothetical protein